MGSKRDAGRNRTEGMTEEEQCKYDTASRLVRPMV